MTEKLPSNKEYVDAIYEKGKSINYNFLRQKNQGLVRPRYESLEKPGLNMKIRN